MAGFKAGRSEGWITTLVDGDLHKYCFAHFTPFKIRGWISASRLTRRVDCRFIPLD